MLAPPAAGAPRARRLAALALAALMLWGAHAWLTIVRPGRALFSFDSAEYALAGRELARTGRLATPFSYVGALREGVGPPYPLIAGHPLLPLLEAPVFRLFGAHAWGSLVPVAAAYVATVLLAALLALEAGASWGLAIAVALALAATPAILGNACDGLSELPFTAAWTGALWRLARARRSSRPVVIGVLLGLAHLARPVVVPALPAWIAAVAWLAPPRARLRAAGALLAGFVPFALALLLYKWRTTGHPFADVGGIMLLTNLSPRFAEHDVARLLHPPAALEFMRAHPGALVAKVRHALPLMASQALRLGGWACGLAFAWWVVRPRRDGDGPLRLATGCSLAALVALAAFTLPRSQYLFPMLPAGVALGALELERIARRARLPAGPAVALVAAILSWSSLRPLAAEWASLRATTRPATAFGEDDFKRLGSALAARLPAGTLVASDVAPWVSWYADRPSVNIPLDLSDLAELHERHGVNAVVLSNEWLIARPGNEAWREAFEGRTVPPGWVPADTLAFGALRVRLLLPR